MVKRDLGDLYLDRARRIMSALGVWVTPCNESAFRKLYRYFMLSLQFLFLLFQIIYMSRVIRDLEEVSQASFLLFTQASLCFKVVVFEIKTDSFKELLALMNSEVFMPQTNIHETILKQQAVRIKRLLMGFMISSQATCSMFALRPLFDDTNRIFPFKMWMPVSSDHSPQYELGYLFQFLTISMSAFMYFGVDSACLSLVIFGCAQMEIIKEMLMGIKSIANRRLETSEMNAVLEEHYNILIECIERHQAVVNFIQLLENTFHSYLFFQLVGSIGVICMTALRITVVDWKSVQFVSMVMYLMVMCCQLFVCCWSGDELTATSTELHSALYACCWYEQCPRFRRTLLFAMLRASRPVKFRAGRYVTLSRQTFVSALRMSYSYFAVLNQTNL